MRHTVGRHVTQYWPSFMNQEIAYIGCIHRVHKKLCLSLILGRKEAENEKLGRLETVNNRLKTCDILIKILFNIIIFCASLGNNFVKKKFIDLPHKIDKKIQTHVVLNKMIRMHLSVSRYRTNFRRYSFLIVINMIY